MTAVSGFLARRTNEWLDIKADIRTIPNFVNADVFRPGKRSKGAPVIVHVSNFRPVKRSADALRAFYLIRKKRSAKMVFIGDGPEAAAVKQLAARLKVARDVEFLGEERSIHDVLPKASLLLSTSEFEGFGLAPLEAMACGVPVVATAAGGISEVVEHGATGFIVPVGAVEAIAEKAVLVLEDPAGLGAAGRARAREFFSPEKVVGQYERLYEELLSTKSEAANA